MKDSLRKNNQILEKRPRLQPAFSLIEIMLVLMIFSVGILGVANLLIQSIQAQRLNKSNIIANQLAQEGVELVRQKRDTNWLSGEAWDSGLEAGVYCFDYSGYSESLNSDSIKPCPLFISPEGHYNHELGANTPFSRSLRIEKELDNEGDEYLLIESLVTWEDLNRDQEYLIKTILYDWY